MPLNSKIEGTALEGVVSAVKEAPLGLAVEPDYRPEVDQDGNLLDPASHAGVVEMHQKVTTIVRIRGEDGLVHTTFEVDHQYPTREGWVERTPEEVAAKLKGALEYVERKLPALAVVAAARAEAKVRRAEPAELEAK